MRKCIATWVQIPTDYTSDESSDVHPSTRWIVNSRDYFGDPLGSETHYGSTMSTIATSRETTPTDAPQEEIVYILLLRVQLQSTAVNWAAPSNEEIAIDENDNITPERCAYEAAAFGGRNPPNVINYTMKVHLRRWCHPAKLTYDGNDDIVIRYSMSTYDFSEYPL